MRSALVRNAIAVCAASGLAMAVYVHQMPTAQACGCFAPPDPSVPIVQAGERIAFNVKNGEVTAHIQVQYSGSAQEFGWLLPLPSLPTMELGTDELFVQLINQTQPKYRLNREYVGNCPFDPNRNGGLGQGPSNDSADPSPGGAEDGSNPLVLQASVGPYDYAILKADSKQPMLDWLNQNGFFVPAGTDQVVDPYIRTGAYFLALKLRKGNDVGDLQPVVVKYQSELPMIPIILTSVAADPDMGILVWVLGDNRAIPRNYFHTLINDAKVDWLNFGANYVNVITGAANEAERGQTFVTEYAGTSSIMVDVLDPAWRFGDVNELRAITDAEQYINYLNSYGYAVPDQTGFNPPTYSTPMLTLLQRELPVPAALLADGVTPNDYYVNISYYLGWYRDQNPDKYADLDLQFDPVQLTADIKERIIDPTLAAGKMFRENRYLTRMFTTLSPEEMTRDPVFSFNPDLGDVSNVHDARLIYYCGTWGDQQVRELTPARLITDTGWDLALPGGTANNPWVDDPDMPGSYQIQILREEGAPEVVKDNTDLIEAQTRGSGGGGCAVTGDNSEGLASLALLGFIGLIAVRRRRRS